MNEQSGKSKRSIKDHVAASSFWVIVGSTASNITTFVVFAVLARYLGPRDFGLVAFASIFVDLIRLAARAGVPQTLIRRTDWDDEVASNALWLNIGFASVLAVLMGGGLGVLLYYTYDPSLLWVMPALASTLVIDAGRAAHESKLQRTFNYRALAEREGLASVLGGVVGVVMAVMGFGMAALVASRVATSVIQTLATWWKVRWVPRLTLSWVHIKPMLTTGAHLASADLFSQITRRVPDLVLGVFLDPAAVGIYRIGARAIITLNQAVIRPLNASTLSAFSRVRETGSVAEAYCRITRTCAFLTAPVYLGAGAVSQDFIVVCFGQKWAESGTVMMMMALIGGAASLNNFSAPALIAVGRTRLVFYQAVSGLISSVVLALCLVRFGVVAVAVGFAVQAYAVNPFILMLLKRGLGLSPRDALRGVIAPTGAAALMMVVLMLLKHEALMGLGPVTRLAIMMPAGVILYAFFLLIFGRRYLRQMRDELMPFVQRFTKRFAR